MSLIDSLDDLRYQLGRFFLPTLFLVCAIIFMRIALVPGEEVLNNGQTLQVKQSPLFLYGAIFFMLASVIWFLYLFGVIRTVFGYIVMGGLGIVSGFLLYKDYTTVNDDVVFMKEFDKVDRDIRARMQDIKAAEVAYKEFYGRYTNNLDTLIAFVKNGKKMSVPNIGTLPGRTITPEERDYIYGDNRPIDRLMTDAEANKLAHSPNPPADLVGFSRDTIYLPVLDAIFYDAKYKETRSKVDPSTPFHPDSLRYVPHSGMTLVQVDTSSVQKGELTVPTLQIMMVHPMDKAKVYQIGSLVDNHLRDNWSR
jgi:hypothetical protein